MTSPMIFPVLSMASKNSQRRSRKLHLRARALPNPRLQRPPLRAAADFRPARKAHPALLVYDLRGLVARLRQAGVDVVDDELAGYYRVYVCDPFGNRLELMEPLG